MGCSLLLLRPENIFLSRDGQKVKFRSLRGCGKVDEFGKVSMAPDFYINLFDPDIKIPKESDLREKPEPNVEKTYSDPYLAPEQIFCVIYLFSYFF
jgi:serine/threonine protein kinase